MMESKGFIINYDECVTKPNGYLVTILEWECIRALLLNPSK